MWRKLVAQKYFCGFDLGEMTVKASLIKDLDQQPPELLGVYESRTSGFKNNSVTDISELSECIHATVAGLTGKTGIKIKDIQLGVGGELIEKRLSSAVIPLLERGSKVISHQDMRRVQDQAKVLGSSMEEHIIHNFPQYYKVDDVNTALNPLGLYGRKIEVHTLLILVKNTILNNLLRAVHQAGFDVPHVFYTSYSSVEACLSEYHRRQGCALVDIGSSVTDILIFKEGSLKYTVNIPFGGQHLTESISNRLNIHHDLAEEIKRTYAFALNSEVRNDEEILIKNAEGYMPVKKEIIAQALEPAVARLVELIVEALKNSNHFGDIHAGVVLSGGGALLPGLEERVEQAVKTSVKLARINLSAKRLPQGAKYTAAVGLALAGLSRSVGMVSVQEGRLPFQQKLVNKIVEVYQEYF